MLYEVVCVFDLIIDTIVIVYYRRLYELRTTIRVCVIEIGMIGWFLFLI